MVMRLVMRLVMHFGIHKNEMYRKFMRLVMHFPFIFFRFEDTCFHLPLTFRGVFADLAGEKADISFFAPSYF